MPHQQVCAVRLQALLSSELAGKKDFRVSSVPIIHWGDALAGCPKPSASRNKHRQSPVAPSDRQSIVRLVRRESVEHFLHQSPRTGEAEAVVVV